MKKKNENINRNVELEKLIKLVKKHLENIDEEMEHGCYETPESVPYQYEDEEDYYGEHEKIVNKVCDSYQKIRNFIEKYEKNFSR